MCRLKIIIICLFIFADNFNILGQMRVLFVTSKFPYEPRQYINNQIIGFIDEGIDVRILASKSTDLNFPAFDQYQLIEKTYYDTLPANDHDFDIIYCQFGPIGVKILPLIQQKKLTGKLVVCFRGDDATTFLNEDPHYYDELFKYADLILVVCENFKKRLIDFGCSAHKIIVHHSGIDCQKFLYKEHPLSKNEPIKIITVSRLVSSKGHVDVINALKILKEKKYNFKYEIIGTGSMLPKLQNMIDSMHLADVIHIKGHLSHEHVLKILEESHIFVLASYTGIKGAQEGIPNAIMEACAVGLPVVATNHSGIGELIEDGISGFLVPERDIDQLADQLAYLMDKPKLWSKMGIAGNKKVQKNHNKDRQNKKIIKIFSQMIRNGKYETA